MAELRNIRDWCRIHNIEYKELNMNPEINCPYLMPDKSCQIYPVRPFLCRILGVSESLPCPLHKNNPEKVLNQNQNSKLYDDIYMRGKEKPRTEKHRKIIKQVLGI
jgi:Fe-S-cluster containining protein